MKRKEHGEWLLTETGFLSRITEGLSVVTWWLMRNESP